MWALGARILQLLQRAPCFLQALCGKSQIQNDTNNPSPLHRFTLRMFAYVSIRYIYIYVLLLDLLYCNLFVDTCIRVYHLCVRTRADSCLHTCLWLYAHTSVCVDTCFLCSPSSTQIYADPDMYMYLHVYTHTYTHAYIHTNEQANKQTNIRTYMHMFLRIHVHAQALCSDGCANACRSAHACVQACEPWSRPLEGNCTGANLNLFYSMSKVDPMVLVYGP